MKVSTSVPHIKRTKTVLVQNGDAAMSSSDAGSILASKFN